MMPSQVSQSYKLNTHTHTHTHTHTSQTRCVPGLIMDTRLHSNASSNLLQFLFHYSFFLQWHLSSGGSFSFSNDLFFSYPTFCDSCISALFLFFFSGIDGSDFSSSICDGGSFFFSISDADSFSSSFSNSSFSWSKQLTFIPDY